MSVTVAGTAHGASTFLPTSSWHARVPAATLVDDLLVHFVALSAAGAGHINSPTWLPLTDGVENGGEPGIAGFFRFADAGDVGGWAGQIFSLVGAGAAYVAFITVAIRGAVDLTSAVHSHDAAGLTSHTVPGVILPGTDDLAVVFAAQDWTVHTGTPETLSLAGEGFTTEDLVYGSDIFTTHLVDSPSVGLFSHAEPAGGTVGPWTMTTTDTKAMSFMVLGLLAALELKGIVTLPYFVPFGNPPGKI